MRDRCILAVRYTPVSSQVRKQVAGFVKYIEHRDQHRDQGARSDPAVAGVIKYIAYRDRSAQRGLLFGPDGVADSHQRRALTAFIARSVEGSRPQLIPDRDGRLQDRRRACYRFVLSPENARGLDLQQLTRAAMSQLEQDAGGLGPWIAAEHRNTAHPHVHIVLSARREIAPGRYRTVNLTRPRLARMKAAIEQELERQRGRAKPLERSQRRRRTHGRQRLSAPWRLKPPPRTRGLPRADRSLQDAARAVSWRLRSLAAYYRWEAEREAQRQRELDRERGR